MDPIAIISWFVFIIAFVILEAVTAQLVSVWFIVGSIAAFLAAIFRAPLWLQIVLFFVVSILILVFFRPMLMRKFGKQKQPTNADMVIGKTAVVLEEINNTLESGRVSVMNQDWAARTVDGEVVKRGKTVLVQEIQGVKLIVKKA